MTIYDIILTVVYLMMWIATLGWYQWKYRNADAGTVIILSYVLYAVFSIHNICDPEISAEYDTLSFFPYIYLYGMLMLALSPVMYHHYHPVSRIEEPNTYVIHFIAIIVAVCAILQIPDIIINFKTGIINLLVDSEAGQDAYQEQLENVSERGHGINNLVSIIFNALSEIGVFLFFYFLSKRNVLVTIGLAISLVVTMMLPVMKGQRGPVIVSIETIIMAFFFFRKHISQTVVKIIQWIGSGVFALISVPIIAITISRFGERDAGVFRYLSWYVGQASLYFNNHALDAGGTRNGDRTMNLIKRIIDSDTPANFYERREKYHNLELDDNLFSTFVGDFCIDFGPIFAFVIFVVFNMFVLSKIRKRGSDGSIALHQMLLLFFTSCICMQGGMTLFTFSDTSNLKIIAFLMVYTYLLYHDGLLKKFPKER